MDNMDYQEMARRLARAMEIKERLDAGILDDEPKPAHRLSGFAFMALRISLIRCHDSSFEQCQTR